MGKPSASFLSFSNFAKISLPFFQHALSSFTESSERLERQEDEPPTMAKVVTQAQKEALHNGLVSILYLSLSLHFFFFLIFFLTITLSVPIGVDVGTKESELAIAKEAKKPTPIVQTTEAQPRIPHIV